MLPRATEDSRRLVVTADDFGLAPEVNDAVELAHRHGILSAASLMVTGPAAAAAIALARRLPSLRVGLHLTLLEEHPALPRSELGALVGPDGRLRRDMTRLAIDLARSARARGQLGREIAAQFEAFRQTGLPLDHVNAHKHIQVHPIVARQVLALGPNYGMRALRAPVELRHVLRGIEGSAVAGWDPAMPWALLLRWRARRAGLRTADAVFGTRWSGQMSANRLKGLIEHLPPGLNEIYLHPATGAGFAGSAAGYRYAEELAALCDPEVTDALRKSAVRATGYA